jgi:cell division protein FtsI (penicillin-binding protein 3)
MRKVTKKRARKDLKQVAFTRFMFIVAVFVLWFGAIGARLVYLQVKQHDDLSAKAAAQRKEVRTTKQPRGTIFDRNGRVLALSVNVQTLYADATEIADVTGTAKKLAKVLSVNESRLSKQLAEARDLQRRYVPLVKHIEGDEYVRINKALEDRDSAKSSLPRFTGLYWRADQRRRYPQQTLAAHVIGFSNADGVGQAGIEQSQNDELYGTVIRKTQERDRLGRVYDETVSEQEPPKDVVLTISVPVQFAVDEALARGVKAAGAKSGMAVVIDNKTGEILALSNYPTFDPNHLDQINSDNLTDNVIQSVYSPGSVFKLLTYGAALERKLITPQQEIDAGNGTIEVARHKFRDSHAVGRVSYSKALAHSSNVCAIKTSLRVGKDGFHALVRQMGFGRPTGIELPAETGGIVRPVERWNGDSLASMSIGYEIGVSALQMANAFATIANDGVRIQPHIIKEIRQSDETVVQRPEPERTTVVSPETARDLRTMLREVVLTGTGKRAQLNGYSSAGKTGTAWKFNPKLKKVDSGKYISSFIGFAPAASPAVTIAVVMDEPKVGGRDGGTVSAPVFKEIAEAILPELGVAQDMETKISPDAQTAEDIPETPDENDAPNAVSVPPAKPDVRLGERSAERSTGNDVKAPVERRDPKASDPRNSGKTAVKEKERSGKGKT